LTAALKFQRLWKVYFGKKQMAATKIQAVWRGHVTYKKFHKILKNVRFQEEEDDFEGKKSTIFTRFIIFRGG
jgi:hypothetical protein